MSSAGNTRMNPIDTVLSPSRGRHIMKRREIHELKTKSKVKKEVQSTVKWRIKIKVNSKELDKAAKAWGEAKTLTNSRGCMKLMEGGLWGGSQRFQNFYSRIYYKVLSLSGKKTITSIQTQRKPLEMAK